jgi:RimJ/RimL family protein N-acetyltransferase
LTQEDVAAFVARELGFARGFGECAAIGFGTPLVAGFVYHNWNPEAATIEISGASTRRDWCNKSLLRIIFDYPFDQLGCQLVIARHSVDNTRVRRIWKSLGADEYIIPRLRGRNDDEAIATLTVEAWRKRKM